MHDLLNTYIRALTEREDRPQTSQDLGTFVTWLLERQGFRVVMRAVRYGEGEVLKSAGDLQSGVDIRALRKEGDEEVLYRFVLKTGNLTQAGLAGSKGTMGADLWAAARLDEATDTNYTHGERSWSRVVVVAVHNGDVQGTDLQGQLKTFREDLLEQAPRIHQLDWWDADRLLDLALAPPRDEDGQHARSETELFSPSVRPFVRLVLDSLRWSGPGQVFDLGHVDRLLDEVLPRVDAGLSLSNRVEVKPTPLRRHATLRFAEVGLFVHMLWRASGGDAGGNTLPALDTIERVLCRMMAVLPGLPEAVRTSGAIEAVIKGIIAIYVEAAEVLAERLGPLLGREGGLALGFDSERLDYPIRVLRFSGYLATAGQALLGKEGPDALVRARALAETVAQMWARNPGGALMPVMDDQIIELGLVWELWLRLGMNERVGESCMALLQRLVQRQRYGLPMPLIWRRTRIPMDRDDLETLVDAHLRPEAVAPELQRVSTIAALASYLARVLGTLDRLAVEEARPFEIIAQVWQPPSDAGQSWYDQELVRVGATRTYGGAGEGFVESFRAFCQPIEPSVAELFGAPVIDRMAWKVFRTPMPMAVFLQAVLTPTPPTVNVVCPTTHLRLCSAPVYRAPRTTTTPSSSAATDPRQVAGPDADS